MMPEANHRRRIRNIDEAIAQAWPDGLDTEGRTLLTRLSPEDRSLVVFRLQALLEVEDGQRPASRAPTDDPRGLTNSGFQSLVRRWRLDRHPRTLLPYAGRAKRQRGQGGEYSALELEVDRLLAEQWAWPVVTLAKKAMERVGTSLTLNTVRTIARDRRALLRANTEWLDGHYGRTILNDICALGIHCDLGIRTETAVVALTIETASGLILGHATGPIGEAMLLQSSSLSDAASQIIAGRLDVRSGEGCELTLVVAPGDPGSEQSMVAALQGIPSVQVISNEWRRVGDRAADALDGAINTLRLHPRGAAARSAGQTPWSRDHLDDVVAQSIQAHNAVRLIRLKEAGILDGESNAAFGDMVDALRPVIDSL